MQLGWNAWCFRKKCTMSTDYGLLHQKARWKSHMQQQQTWALTLTFVLKTRYLQKKKIPIPPSFGNESNYTQRMTWFLNSWACCSSLNCLWVAPFHQLTRTEAPNTWASECTLKIAAILWLLWTFRMTGILWGSWNLALWLACVASPARPI